MTAMTQSSEPLKGELVRDGKGRYVKGVSGNPLGRPEGSKNRISVLKMATEEAWRDRNQEKLDAVLDMILEDALNGDKGARKMIFDAVVSKANVQEDKAAGHKQEIKVHRMVVNQGNSTADEEKDDG